MQIEYGIKYILCEQDKLLIQNMSESICKQKRDYFVNNFKKDKTMSLYEMNLNGFGAELAFCRLCKIDFDSSINENENHFIKSDCVLPDKRTVDVKNTIYKNGNLIIRCGKQDFKIDVYVLMIGVFAEYYYSGWASYNQIIKPERIKNLGWGDAYCMAQNELNKILKI